MEKLIDLLKYLPILTSAVGTFALIAAVTSNKTDDKIVNFLLKAINFLGANFGKAKNVDE